MKIMKIRPIVDGKVKGKAIVSPIPISFLGGVDPETGAIIDSENPLFGEKLAGKIFVFPESKGSTVGSYVIYALKENKVAPLAFIANEAETIVIAGAILANIPLIDLPAENIVESIDTGDALEIDTTNCILKIKKK